MKVWLKGLIAAIISGAATAISAYLTSGNTINGKQFVGIVVTGSAVGLTLYLKQSPIDKYL